MEVTIDTVPGDGDVTGKVDPQLFQLPNILHPAIVDIHQLAGHITWNIL